MKEKLLAVNASNRDVSCAAVPNHFYILPPLAREPCYLDDSFIKCSSLTRELHGKSEFCSFVRGVVSKRVFFMTWESRRLDRAIDTNLCRFSLLDRLRKTMDICKELGDFLTARTVKSEHPRACQRV